MSEHICGRCYAELLELGCRIALCAGGWVPWREVEVALDHLYARVDAEYGVA